MTLLLISQANKRAEQTWTLMETVKDPGRIMDWLICESLVVVVFLKEKHTEPFVLVYSQMLAALLMSCSFGSLGLCPFGRLSHSRIIGWMINVETMRFKCCFEVVSTCFIYAENWNGDVFPGVIASPVNIFLGYLLDLQVFSLLRSVELKGFTFLSTCNGGSLCGKPWYRKSCLHIHSVNRVDFFISCSCKLLEQQSTY